MTGFGPEIANAIQAASHAKPGARGPYAVPWYLVLGPPRSGRTTVLRSLNLTYLEGAAPLPHGVAQQQCDYWVSSDALFIEPGGTVIGPSRFSDRLKLLSQELLKRRPREPLDGIMLVLSVLDFVDLDEEALDAFAHQQRKDLVEVCAGIGSEIPVYIVLNRYDTLWGFAEVFAWNANRAKEDPWGFRVPPNTPSHESRPKVEEGFDGLAARVEAMCLEKLSSEEGVEQRIKAFWHLVESREMLKKLREVLRILGLANAYERPPWLRSLIVGSAVPGMGDRIRAGIQRFSNMGLLQAPYDPARPERPGGLPLHGYMKDIVLPERDLVPLRTRWRDDLATVLAAILGLVLLVVGIVLMVI